MTNARRRRGVARLRAGRRLWRCAGAAVVLAGLTACAAPRCQVPVDVALTRHPEGKPRPAATVLVSCADPAWTRTWVCAAVDVSPTGLWCDGEQRVEVSP